MEPTIRFAQSGSCVLTLRLKANKRVRDSNGEWTDGPTPLFIDATCFGKLAENAAESILKGDTVVIDGVLEQQEWADKETGEKRVKVAVIIEEIGLSTRWGKVISHKMQDEGYIPVASAAPQTDEAPF
jgi:single-strand DNA-binding protein